MTGRQLRPRPAAITLCLVLAGLWLAWSAAAQNDPALAAGTVLTIEGRVEVLSGGATAWQAAQPGQKLSAGDQVRTGERSRATVRLSDLSVLRISELMSCEILPPPAPGGRPVIDIKAGAAYFFSRDQPQEIQVQTPVATGAIRGTEFGVTVAADGTTEWTLINGAVELHNPAGSVLLQSGQQAVVAAGQAPVKTAVLNAVNTIQWNLYYPAVLEVGELGLTEVEQAALNASLTAYRAGSLPEALKLYPADLTAPEQVEVRFSGKPLAGELPDQWQPVKFSAAAAAFREEFTLPAGGWYRLEVRVAQGGRWVATNDVEHVGVGEVFVIAGQSNSANYGEAKNRTLTGLVAAFGGTNWQLAADPEPGAGGKKGSFMPVFGDAMVAQFHVPVGLVPMGIGSTSVREWLPAGIVFTNPPTLTGNVVAVAPGQWESTGKIFQNFCARMKQFGPRGFRAVLWHQGESDGRQAKPECSLAGGLYHEYLGRVIEDSRRETGWAAPWFVAQASYHNPGDPANLELRAAQKALWDEGVARPGPDTDTLTGAMREKNGQGIHLSAAGLQAHGHMWAARVGPWLERELGSDHQ